MTLSMRLASVPVFTNMLSNLSTWLDKAVVHAQAKKFDPQTLLTARLAPDMPSRLRKNTDARSWLHR